MCLEPFLATGCAPGREQTHVRSERKTSFIKEPTPGDRSRLNHNEGFQQLQEPQPLWLDMLEVMAKPEQWGSSM